MHEDVPYQVSNVPLPILNVWSRLAANNPGKHFIHPDRLILLRQQVLRHPLSDEAKLCSVGSEIVEADLLSRRLHEELERKKDSPKKKLRVRSATHKSATGISTGTNDLKITSAARNVSAADKIKEMQQELRAALARLDDFDNEGTPASPTKIRIQPSLLLHKSPVAQIRVHNTVSSKLNYIIEEVRTFQQ